MKIIVSGKISLLLLSAVATGVTYIYYNKKNKYKELQSEINEVVMFDGNDLTEHVLSRCLVSKSLEKLLYYLNSAQCSIDVCMFIFTNIDIKKSLLNKHHKGLKIRLILDKDMMFSTKSVAKEFLRENVSIRCIESKSFMHHKFCLIDASAPKNISVKPLLLYGSLNWTNSGLCANWEDCVVTSKNELVSPFKNEFERLWEIFPPVERL